MEELDILILGAGWTATFLIPLLAQRKLAFAATTTTGRTVANHPTIPFKFDPSASDIKSSIAALPRARYILITFPLTGKGPSRLLAETYERTHLRDHNSPPSQSEPEFTHLTTFKFIQLGSTGVWQSSPSSTSTTPQTDHHHHHSSPWLTRHSPLTTLTPRTEAEAELVSLGGCILHLAGLWDGVVRVPSNWINRVGATRDAVRAKGSLHMIHGVDVARAILGVVDTTSTSASASDEDKWAKHCRGQRWMLTDGFVYDWWALFAGWADVAKAEEVGEEEPTKQARWVYELMVEEDVRALPRSMGVLKRCYDTREFWSTFGVVPLKGRIM